MGFERKSELTVFTVEEIINDIGNHKPNKRLYELRGVNDFLYEIEVAISDLLNEIELVEGIDALDKCRELLMEIERAIY